MDARDELELLQSGLLDGRPDPAHIRVGSSWFGNPPFELPRRERIEVDPSLTHRPSCPRYLNHPTRPVRT